MLNPVPDVSTPRGLTHLLRHKELWPGSVYDWQARSKITPEMVAQALEDAAC